MNKIFQYTLIFLIISPLTVLSQNNKEEWRYEGLRVGIDLSRFLLDSYQPADRGGWEVQMDFPVKDYLFPTIELGTSWVDDKKDNFHYKSNGGYGRLGLDVNILSYSSLSDGDMLFVGLRYGYSQLTHEATDVSYPNYWGSLETHIPQRTAKVHWGEFVFGLKAEVIKNVFLGWSARMKLIFSQTDDTTMKPYIVPGLGKTTVDVPMDFTLGIYYRFPMRKTKEMPGKFSVSKVQHIDESQERPRDDMEGEF